MDANKIRKLEELVSTRLTPYFESCRRNEGRKVVRLELTLIFKTDEEIEKAIKGIAAE